MVPVFHRRAWHKRLEVGQLVYYGPMPTYYGIGEILEITDNYVVVDFRGTGLLKVHEEVFEPQYLIPIPPGRLSLL